ncbi:hypothetical protein PInf_005610 [Phytophthora infestans]|nr:hypothetical protein PInf_005610 [Phytophthora infestans]
MAKRECYVAEDEDEFWYTVESVSEDAELYAIEVCDSGDDETVLAGVKEAVKTVVYDKELGEHPYLEDMVRYLGIPVDVKILVIKKLRKGAILGAAILGALGTEIEVAQRILTLKARG